MGRIEVDEDRCKGCELCISFCPKKVIALASHFNRLGYRPAALIKLDLPASSSSVPEPDRKRRFYSWRDHPSHHDLAECTGCGICALVCPDVAITVYRERPE